MNAGITGFSEFPLDRDEVRRRTAAMVQRVASVEWFTDSRVER